MSNLAFLNGAISQLSDNELKSLAADICHTLRWPVKGRSIIHLFPLGIASTNHEAVHLWLQERHFNTELPFTYKELCWAVYTDLSQRNDEWHRDLGNTA